tara:strand:+ start:904 stop:1218 length:315 start_codon:yes stop_codon:yes gene_type:complete
MARKAKGPGFIQRSGKSPAFKMMGSSPVKQEFEWDQYYTDQENPEISEAPVTPPIGQQPGVQAPSLSSTPEPEAFEFESTPQLPGEYYEEERFGSPYSKRSNKK